MKKSILTLLLALTAVSCSTVKKTPEWVHLVTTSEGNCFYINTHGLLKLQDGTFVIPTDLQLDCTGELESDIYFVFNLETRMYKTIVGNKWYSIEDSDISRRIESYLLFHY